MEGINRRENDYVALYSVMRVAIDDIKMDLEICKHKSAAPRRFKLTIRIDARRFNSCVEMYSMF